MATYTKITTQLAQEILELYGIENIKTITPMSSGISNTNYKVEIENSSTIILKISNSKPISEIQQEQDILLYLHQQGFKKCLAPLKTTAGKQVYEHNGLLGVVYPFIEGEIPDLSMDSMYEIGCAIGELHTIPIVEECPLRKFDDLGYGFEQIIDYINSEDCLEPFKNFFIDLIDEELLNTYLNNTHPLCVLHGDLYYDNCLVNEDGKILRILDFEQAGLGDPLFDIGISISGSCLNNGEIDPELVESYMDGYKSKRQLSESEEKLLDFAIVMGLFSIALWRIERFNKNKIDSSKVDNYLELLQRAANYVETVEN